MTAATRTRPPRRRTPSAHAAKEARPSAAGEDRQPSDFVPLKTERLTLRPFVASDAADLHRLINDFDVAKMLELVSFPYSRDLADKWIAAAISDLASGGAVHLAVTGQEAERE